MARPDARPLSLLRGPALAVALAALAALASPTRADFHLNGDFDCSYAVDLTDLSILLANFGGAGTSATGDMDGNLLVELADLALFLAMGTSCCYDVNADGAVDLSDLAIVLTNVGIMVGATFELGDVNCDGAVTDADAALVAGQIGRSC
jgi:hypothetical protein